MITVTNTSGNVQKVQFQLKGKKYGQPVDGSDNHLSPFEEQLIQPGEKLDLDPVASWVKVLDMGLGKDAGTENYFG